MKLIDRFVIKDKSSEKLVRELFQHVEDMSNSNVLDKKTFIEINSIVIELMIVLFKRLDDNRSPAKTLLEFTGNEVQDACNRVGSSNVFSTDRDFVIAVMQELTKK